ncbi:hypothetical protein [Pseudomonas sp. Pc102]|nr:hypothetical protein [Pseudomonas sp. Pc102]
MRFLAWKVLAFRLRVRLFSSIHAGFGQQSVALRQPIRDRWLYPIKMM